MDEVAQTRKTNYIIAKLLKAAEMHLRGFEEFRDDVIGFSGLGDFIHLPVKTYSQGMAARLLFAVLTGGSHDCLAMDEGFGAGDTSFYEKAQERMTRFLSSAGTLLLQQQGAR